MGTLINAVAIIIGGALGLLFRERFPERMTQTALHVMGLFTLLVGVRMAIQGEELIMVLISLALGAMLGEWMNIEDRLERFGLWLETRLHLTEQSPAKGFINASLLFCVGSMAIVGSITEGLNGDRSILVTKAIMDGILSIAFAAGMGVGVLGSALPILLYQGSLTLLASKLQAFFTPPMIGGLTSVGGVIVMGIGVNILGLKKVRVGNVIPALVIIILILYFKALM
ncbi:MAG: DUF554 domain-containing protein [Deltaproteobacteria bacterium]